MLAYAPMSTPMLHTILLYANKGLKLNEQEATICRRLIRHLIYLTKHYARYNFFSEFS